MYDPAGWPPDLTQRANEADTRLHAALTALISRLAIEPDRALAALIDLPYALVRRHLEAGRSLLPALADLAEQRALKLITG